MGSTMEVVERPLTFALNGEKVVLQHVDPTMTLLTYLRTQTLLKGTKLGCGEGGCGACVVLVSKYDTETKKIDEFTVNSCLVLLCSLDGGAVTTIEGIGNSHHGLHAVQKRFAGFHASQCGFCTPGMCMSIVGALKKHEHEKICDQSKQLSVGDLERSVAGNICRCTGYRPISDVCKSLADDSDVEDIGVNIFWSLDHKGDRNLLPGSDTKLDGKFPEFLVKQLEEPGEATKPTLLLNCQNINQKWIRPGTLHEVFSTLKLHKQKQEEVKIVVGNTSTGIYKSPNPEVLVDISAIPELLVERESELGIEVGGALRISKLISILESYSSRHAAYQKLADHLKRVASPHVRNAGSIGGNLIMAQKLGFDSDIATLFLGAGVSVKLAPQAADKEIIQTLDDFLECAMDGSSVLKSILIPVFKSEAIKFDSYRASPRPFGNSVAYVNAAFLVELSDEGRIENSRLAFGAFGEKHAYRATEVESFLEGKLITDEVMVEAIQLAKNSVVPKKGTTKSGYRTSLIGSFLFKFLNSLRSTDDGKIANGSSHRSSSSSVIVGKQTLQEHTQGALGRPLSKVMAELQASGEAVYVDDIPAPIDCVHAAFVYSEKALAKINGIDLQNALASPGAVGFVGIKDIPSNGRNVGVDSDLVKEALFADEIVECIGQPLGLMVADTLRNARTAATKVEVKYDTESLGPPAITIEDSVAKNDFYQIPPVFQSNLMSKVGNASAEFEKASYKIENAVVETGSQYYFYMEPQTALVVPDEDDCLVVYAAAQCPEFVQASVATCLGIPMHNVRAITRRVGGGFGGKATKACIVATACALAAYKLRRPVRLTLDRNTDMIMMSGRHPMKAVYSAGFDSDGKVKALQAQVFIQAGWSQEMSGLMPVTVMNALKKYDWGAYDVDFKVCRTNTPSRTSVRGPGDTQGSFFADAIVEHIAAVLKMSSEKVAERNLHSVETASAVYGAATIGGSLGYTLPLVWEKLKAASDFEKRSAVVESFNSSSVWKKRGLAISQCSYLVILTTKPGRVTIFTDGSVAVEVGGIDIGQGLWTKVRQTVAAGLSQAGCVVDVSRVRVVQADSISLGNGGWTGGSTTSESSCEAVRLACNVLVERLKPVKASLPEDAPWEALVMAAKFSNVVLAAQAGFVPEPGAMQYVNYGVAASEVEIDVLTGEHEILQTDIVYDCGKSMNPAVDIGQIEGAFVQGLGFFTTEEYVLNEEGRLMNDGTWTYKPPTMDNVPRKLNVQLLNSEVHKDRILSSKASGEPPLLLASSVHGAIRHAIAAARKDVNEETYFRLDTPVTIDKVRNLCGANNIEKLLYRK